MPRPFEIADVAIGSVPLVFSFRDGPSRPGPESINIGLSGRSPICVHGFRLTGGAGAPERRWPSIFYELRGDRPDGGSAQRRFPGELDQVAGFHLPELHE